MSNIIYIVTKTIALFAVRFFYRGIEINGKDNIPKDKAAIIFAVNHQNAFLDAVIIGSMYRHHAYFMTRSDVFKPPFDYFLRAFKMMPIYRIRDGYRNLSKNDAIFETCKNLLSGNNGILIFPEGNHGLNYFLRPLTKGISRIALQSQAVIDQPIHIIPVGLNYFHHTSSGHKLILNYGEPINVKNYLEKYHENNNQGLVAIKEDISQAMKKQLIIPSDNENYKQQKYLLDRGKEKLNFSQLQSQISEYTGQVKREPCYPRLKYLGNLIAFTNAPIIWLIHWVLQNKVKQVIFSASIKIGVIILIYPFYLLLSFAIAGLIWGVKVGLILIAVQLVTLFIRREINRFSHCKDYFGN